MAIGDTRCVARDFLASLQAVHGLPVSERASGMVQLVVTELVTNARKYAPGPCLLSLEACEGGVAVSVWDSCTVMPLILPPDPARVGQHGLEIVTAVCRSFEVHREPVGKRVRAVLTLADDPGGAAAGRQLL
ncbi:ATP-binding protein [Streptomyces sp. NPDC102365]|uniref:ATP-binding protein n=1 Tax=Streptomyces sp. NPDC102365 TaxID=3366162 RepID=UPI00381E599D